MHNCRTFGPTDVVVNVTVEAASAVPIWWIPYYADKDSDRFNATRVYSSPDSAIVVLQEDVPMMDVTLYAYPATVLNVGTSLSLFHCIHPCSIQPWYTTLQIAAVSVDVLPLSASVGNVVLYSGMPAPEGLCCVPCVVNLLRCLLLHMQVKPSMSL